MSEPIYSVTARRVVEVKKKSALAFIFRFLDWLVSYIPTHRDSSKGRKSALQIRAGLIVCGVLIVGFAGRTWIFVGIAVMALALIAPMAEMRRPLQYCSNRTSAHLALIAPMAEMRRRSIRAVLKRAQTRKVEDRVDVEVVFDGRRVLVRDAEGDSLVRVLTNKETHEILERNFAGQRAIGIKGPGKKKRQQIWLVTNEAAREELAAIAASDMALHLEAQNDRVDELLEAMETA